MEKLYTQSDIERWQLVNGRKLAILERRLGREALSSEDAQGLSMLGLAYLDAAFTHFAIGDSSGALALVKASVQCKLQIYELYEVGVQGSLGYIRTGDFQTVLNAYASGDLALASRFANKFTVDLLASENSPEDSNFLGEALKALCLDDFDRAMNLLARPKPRIDSQFAGYVECLESIASRSSGGFTEAVQAAKLRWHAFMKEKFRGHPQAVCFLGGLGFQRLAENKLGKTFEFGFCNNLPS